MDDRVLPEGGDNGMAAPGRMSSTIWIQCDQLDQLDVIQRYLAKPDQPGWLGLADAFAVEARRRGSE